MREPYLDGLRGWAAIAVVLHHLLHITIFPGWRNYLPAIPFFADGTFAVFVFFVLSGYVLSAGFFKTGQRAVVVDLALRRYFRLTIPILVISAIGAAMMYAGWMVNGHAGYAAGSWFWWSYFYQFEPSVADVLNFSLYRVYVDANAMTSYNSSLWTMPVEMQGSIAVFAVLLVAGGSRSARLAGHALLLGATWWLDSSIFALALGCALADFRYSRHFHQFEVSEKRVMLSRLMILSGLMLAAMRWEDNSPVQLAFASLALIFGVMLSDGVRRALSTPISQWVGRLSFSIYLVQIPVMCSFTAWGFMALYQGHGISALSLLALFVSSLALIMLSAMAFYPVEKLGIMVGRKFSQAIFKLARPTVLPLRTE
jgi:peptidoglycan/LPS O-acetylase OafA/YrhL